MKVKIVKASQPTYWYANNIGETFEVDDTAGCYSYTVINNPKYKIHCISKCDCEIISDTVKIPFTFSAWDKDRSQKVWTRDGQEVSQIAYFECLNQSPILGVVDNKLFSWKKDGMWVEMSTGKDLFLEHTEKEYFVNVFRDSITGDVYYQSHPSTESFEAAEKQGKTACNYIKTISFKA